MFQGSMLQASQGASFRAVRLGDVKVKDLKVCGFQG